MRPGRLALGLLVIAVGLFGGAPAAWAGAGLGIVPTVPQNVTLGQTSVASSLVITNISTNGPGEVGYETDSFRITDITLVLSCGSQVFSADCPAGARDPGVLVPSPLTAAGRAGTACAGIAFTIAEIDAAQGKYRFTPSANVTLGPSGGPVAAARCTIDYTAAVVRAPALDSDVPEAGLQTDQKAFAASIDIGPTNTNQTAGGIGTAQTTVARAVPAINTQASPAINLGGGTLTDTATVTGLVNPVTGVGAGTVTFALYGPNDANCATPILIRAGQPLTLTSATSGTATSGAGFTPTAPGTYRWIASYSGDANNAPVAGACGDANEQTVVRPLPAIAVVKTVDPAVRPVPGGQFTFTVRVSNPGPETIRILTLSDNVYGNIANATGPRFSGSTCGALIGTTLAPGAQSAPCTFVGTFTSATPASETDIVTVTGQGVESGTAVTDDDDAVVTLTLPGSSSSSPPPPPPPPPAGGVSPASSVPSGTARAIAPSGCVYRNFNVTVTGRQIRRVVFYLDGRKVRTLTRPNRGTRFVLPVRPGTLRRGTHRVLAMTYFTTASGTRSRALRVTFSRCARTAVAPRFTG